MRGSRQSSSFRQPYSGHADDRIAYLWRGRLLFEERRIPLTNRRKDARSAIATAGIEWEDTMQQMNAMSNTKNVTWQLVDEATGKVNEAMNSDWQFAQGDVVKVEIFNDPASVHPMQFIAKQEIK